MTDQDKKEFMAIMTGLAEDKGLQLSAAGIALKFEALKGFDIEQIRNAALCMMREKKFSTMPSVADFAEYLGGGRVEDIAEIEAAKVCKAIAQVGGWKPVVFDNAITQAVIQYSFGGWPKLCEEMKEDQQKWFIKDFVKSYGAYARQRIVVTGLLPGRGIGEPVLIGDKEKALQIMAIPQQGLAISEVPQVKQLVEKYGVDNG